jgi:hypothetical protein
MKIRRLGLMVIFGFFSLGCGSSNEDKSYCDVLAKCSLPGFVESQCQSMFEPILLSDACWKAFSEASCEDHAKDNPSYNSTCFPSCSQESAVCASGLITLCHNGQQSVVSCSKLCESKGLTYSGVCAKEYNGQQSTTGLEICWCLQ